MTHTDLLNGLPPGEAERVISLGKRMVLSAGAELFHLGDSATIIYLVLQGRLRLTLPMQVRGREEDIFVEEISAGQTAGWSALIPPYCFTLTATAALQTEVLAIPSEALSAHFEANPQIAYTASLNLASVIGQRLQLFQTMWLREMQRLVELRCA